jgi:hypothetical protein
MSNDAEFWRTLAIGLATVLNSAVFARADSTAPGFQFEVRPILAKNCFACHGPDEAHREADLRLDERKVAVESGAIVPDKPDDSELVRRIRSDDPDERMPPAETGRQLSAAEIQTLREWIAGGAKYAQHWSYEPPQRPPLPKVSQPDWCRNPIDYFVLARLDKAGLTPEPEADRYRLIRRLSLDIIGLPPTIEEVDAFVQDKRPDAYERLVDRLLASPAYGEHWARKWLDLARYADTTGYEKDSIRKIWPFRDWVINALNADMPFDEFTIEQLAGDLLPNTTKDQIIATAFHRNSMQNDEGGVDKEEYRVAAVIDRVNTTMQVWMGTTMGCCQCHSHKYDPFPHEEYYKLFAFFNQTEDANRYDQEPLVLTPTLEQQKLKSDLERQLEESKLAYATKCDQFVAAQRDWEVAITKAIDWKPLKPSQVTSQGGATCNVSDDGTVCVSGTRPDIDSYTIQTDSDLKQITALRLEAIPDKSLPQGRAGRADDGSFVVSKVQVFQEPIQPAENVKYVRVELPRHDWLTLAEVQVFRGDENVARARSASQSSTAYEGFAKLAIDGSTDPHFSSGRSISHTFFNDHPWWEVELAEPTRVDRVAIWNEEGHPRRLIGGVISLLDSNREPVWKQTMLFSPDLTETYPVDVNSSAQIAWAGATSERKEFPAVHAIESHDPKLHGWAPSATANDASSLRLGFERPIELRDPHRLKIVVDQQAHIDGHVGQTLGRFRLYATDRLDANTTSTVPQYIATIAGIAPDQRMAAQADEITTYFRSIQPELKVLAAQRENIERRLSDEYRPDKTPIMKELAASEQRKTHVFIRGSFLSPGEEVTPDTPHVFPAFGNDLPRNRLGLARWLVDRRNPLTARVVANRHWEQLFNKGIVLTSEDFGSQGVLPTHPALLDWLAVELMDNGWSLKKLAKTIVMSTTYRQSSRTTPEKLERDPENRLLFRGPRARLSAEQIRDQALAISGLLSQKLGGPSVMPPQPEGVWQVVYSDDRWVTSHGEDRYRRGIYTFWRRTSPYPSAMALDATSRETCTIRRVTTNTPIAAFALLNDPVYVEAAQALAREIVKHGGSDSQSQATYAFRRVLLRPPVASEVERLVTLYDSEHSHYENHRDAAIEMATSEHTGASTPDAASFAAWTVVSNVLLNLDETLTK